MGTWNNEIADERQQLVKSTADVSRILLIMF
jgi:hypothetical protein